MAYRVLVGSSNGQVLSKSGFFADFKSARSELVSQLLLTGLEGVEIDHIEMEQQLAVAEALDQEHFNTPFILGGYAHVIYKQRKGAINNA